MDAASSRMDVDDQPPTKKTCESLPRSQSAEPCTVAMYYAKQEAFLARNVRFVDEWLKLAWLRFARGQVNAARNVLATAFQHIIFDEKIWLAAIRMEFEVGEFQRAEALIDNAMKSLYSDKLWILALKIKRLRATEKFAMAKKACETFPTSAKLALLRVNAHRAWGHTGTSRKVFKELEETFSHDPKFVIAHYRFLKETRDFNATYVLNEAIGRLGWSVDLWLEKADHYAERFAMVKQAGERNIVSKTNRLKAAEIRYCPLSDKTMLISKYLKESYNYSILYEAAHYNWSTGCTARALELVEAALKENPKYGDGWALWYVIVDAPDNAEMPKVVRLCVEAQPDEGDVWERVAEAAENWSMRTEQLLKTVAKELLKFK